MATNKIMTISRLPHSPETYLFTLNDIFSWIYSQDQAGYTITNKLLSEWICNNIGWEKSSDQAARFIISTFLEKGDKDIILLNEWAKIWLSIDDFTIKSELLFDYLDDRIVFFGDILNLLKNEPRNAKDILDHISPRYPSWNSESVIGYRLDWLLACGKIKKNGSLYCINDMIKDEKVERVNNYKEKLNVGEKGEIYVLEYERNQLADYPGLAKKVRRVSTYSARAGYDIQSYYPDGRLKFIEVKATTGKDMPFEITENEWQVAKRFGESYYIYRVYNLNSEVPIIKIIENPTDVIYREPLLWKAHYFVQKSNEDFLSSSGIQSSVSSVEINNSFLNLPRKIKFFAFNSHKKKPREVILSIKIERNLWLGEPGSCQICGEEEAGIYFVGFNGFQFQNEGHYLCLNCLLKYRELFL